MLNVIEALHGKIGIGHEAQGYMKKSGARDLVLRTAKELRKKDASASVVEYTREQLFPYYQYDILVLSWDKQRNPHDSPTEWNSRGVSVSATNTGTQNFLHIEIRSGNEWVLLGLKEAESKDVAFLDKLQRMSLEEKLELAMTLAQSGPVYEYSKGEKSHQDYVRTTLRNRRIY